MLCSKRQLVKLLHQLFFLPNQNCAMFLFVILCLDEKLHLILFRRLLNIELLDLLMFAIQHFCQLSILCLQLLCQVLLLIQFEQDVVVV